MVLVGVGGVFGGLCRFGLGRLISRKSVGAFPVGTFLVNISGAVLMGILTGLGVAGNGYLLLGDGFLGAYTTFSAFTYEGVHLFGNNEKVNAFAYILGTLLLGIICYTAGYAAGKLFK